MKFLTRRMGHEELDKHKIIHSYPYLTAIKADNCKNLGNANVFNVNKFLSI